MECSRIAYDGRSTQLRLQLNLPEPNGTLCLQQPAQLLLLSPG